MSLLSAIAVACTGGLGRRAEARRHSVDTTYGRILARAQAGDVESQHAAGFMLFFGEGVPSNRLEASRWFRRAADRGDPRAQRNLAIMYHLGEGVSRQPEEAERYLEAANAREPGPPTLEALTAAVRDAMRRARPRRAGEATYVTFCAGCHGFNGIAEYIRSPSFALGERLEKSDAELLRSIEHGIGEMPRWDNKLPRGEIAAVLGFVRTLREEYRAGIIRALRTRPPAYFVFGPMQQRSESIAPRPHEDDVERLLGGTAADGKSPPAREWLAH